LDLSLLDVHVKINDFRIFHVYMHVQLLQEEKIRERDD
jgi:hypothetical protein